MTYVRPKFYETDPLYQLYQLKVGSVEALSLNLGHI